VIFIKIEVQLGIGIGVQVEHDVGVMRHLHQLKAKRLCLVRWLDRIKRLADFSAHQRQVLRTAFGHFAVDGVEHRIAHIGKAAIVVLAAWRVVAPVMCAQ
jgi:hypothetical protein